MMQRPSRQRPATLPFSLYSLVVLALALTLTACQPSDPSSSEALTPEETEALLAQLPPMTTGSSRNESSRSPGDSPRAPKPDNRTEPAFVAPDTPEDNDATPPEVVRFAPQGDVDRASLISITFSEPMVAVGSHANPRNKSLPVRIEPGVDGDWRWLDTRSLVFEPAAEAFAMATDYTVTLEKDLTSLAGQPLQAPKRWTFSTPALEMVDFYPSESTPVGQQPLLALTFNQPVSTEYILSYLTLRGDEQTFPLRAATEQEIKHWQEEHSNDRTKQQVFITPSNPLPLNTSWRLTLKADTPAEVGNRRTEVAQTHRFHTAAPLAITGTTCPEASPCAPEQGVSVTFNNPLHDEWSDDWLTLSPQVEGLEVHQYGNQVHLAGAFKPNTNYTVSFQADTRDQFEQTLAETRRISFQLGSYTPRLVTPGRRVLTLPVNDSPQLPLLTRNISTLQVTLRKVTPEHWRAFNEARGAQHRQGIDRVNWPGDVVDTLELSPERDDEPFALTHVALKRALNPQGTGHLLVTIDARDDRSATGAQPLNRSLQQVLWVQVTNLSASTYTTAEGITAWITRLDNGEPVANARVHAGKHTATSDRTGTAILTAPTTPDDSLTRVTLGEDSLILPDVKYRLRPFQLNHFRYPVLTFTDRNLYRPGESVRLKGLVRQLTVTPEGDISLPAGIQEIRWTAFDGNREKLGSGKAPLNPMGAFDVTVPLPDSAASGTGRFEITLEHSDEQATSFYQGFQIQEFRRPEYEVHTRLSRETPIAGEPLEATVNAGYYSGGALPNAEVDWQISLRESHYAPEGWSDYVFGRWQPIWAHGLWPTPEPVTMQASFNGITDSDGTHQLVLEPNNQLSLDALLYPHRLTAESTVTDVNRQQWSDRADTLIHPADRYVGLRTDSLFSNRGEPVSLEWVVVDVAGKPQTETRPVIQVERMTWSDGQQTVKQSLPCEPRADTGHCVFTPEEAGNYRLTATVTDAKNRESQTQMMLWVSGSNAPPSFGRAEEETEIQLIPDRETYQPGDTAKVQIQAPFDDAHAFITIQRLGLKSRQQVTLEGGRYTLSVPITETSFPELTVSVEAVHAGTPARKNAAPQATGTVTLPVSTASRELNVKVTPDESRLKPGAESTVTIEVTDQAGRPFPQGEVTLYAVDESVLSMIGYTTPDAMDYFYSPLPPLVYPQRSRASVFDEDFNESKQNIMLSSVHRSAAEGVQMDMVAPQSSGGSGIALRTAFNPLATFQSTVELDQQGRAEASFTLPDTLTRYRVIAVAYAEKRFGTGESELTVGLPLMVRPSLPRFLNLGDKAELPVVIQNTTDEPMTVALAVRAHNLTLTGTQGRRFTVPANDRREVRFTAQPKQVGEATLQAIVQSEQHQDAAAVTLPVQRPATSEAFAQYGSLTDGNEFLNIAVPKEAYADFGGLSLTTSATQFQSLTDAFLYLLDYPYGCAEQIASRLMAIASLEDLLDAFNTDEVPEKSVIHQHVSDSLARLSDLQNADGGWSFWTRGGESRPYLSVHVTHALLRARDAGYAVPPAMLNRALSYTQKADMKLTNAMGEKASNSVEAYALYVQALADTPDPEAAMALFEKAGEKLSLEAMGWLLNVVAGFDPAHAMREDIHRRLGNQLRETAATASFVDDYQQGGHWVLHGSRRTDAVILDALLNTQPESDLIEKLARGLLNHRRNGHWGNTQENVFVLLALKGYFQTREAEVPDLTARAWLGGQFLGEHRYQGRDATPQSAHEPMNVLKAGPSSRTLALQHEGAGRVYYRLGMEYAPADLQLAPAHHGFRVTRHYEAVNDPDDVKRAEDGTWVIKAGAAVRVRLTMTLPARRHHVALTDRMPAGFEALNPALKTTAPPVSLRETRPRDWAPHWYQHQQLRDDRAEAFSTEVDAGVYHYEYTALATTPGEFVAPPARVEEMYHPETFGRSATETVRVTEQP